MCKIRKESDSATLPSMTATQEFVVPRLIPIISFPDAPFTALRLQRHHICSSMPFQMVSGHVVKCMSMAD